MNAGRGLAMSVFFAIQKGPYDSLLSWPFTCPVTVTLLDQTSSADQGPPRDVTRTFTPNPRPENEAFLGRPVENRNVSLGERKKVVDLSLSLLTQMFVSVVMLGQYRVQNFRSYLAVRCHGFCVRALYTTRRSNCIPQLRQTNTQLI